MLEEFEGSTLYLHHQNSGPRKNWRRYRHLRQDQTLALGSELKPLMSSTQHCQEKAFDQPRRW